MSDWDEPTDDEAQIMAEIEAEDRAHYEANRGDWESLIATEPPAQEDQPGGGY